MRLPRPTTNTQRVLGSAVVVLLTANAFAAAVIAGDESIVDHPAPAEAATASPATEAPRTVTIITTSDGRRLLADPSTPEGRKAIADATRDGGTTQDVSLPATKPSGGGVTVPGLPGATSALDLRQLLDRLGGAGAGIASGGPTTTAGGGGTGPGVVEIGERLVRDLLNNPGGTITSVVGSTQSTVTSVVGSTQSTLTSVVGSTQSTLTSVVDQVAPSTTVPAPLAPIVTTVSTLLQQAVPTPTTAAPPPSTTTTSQPICILTICH